MRTREQEYAETIYGQTERVKTGVDTIKSQFESDPQNRELKKQLAIAVSKKEDYLKMSKKLPVLIRSAGLTQALYFAVTRKGGSKQLVEDLAVAISVTDLLEQSRTSNLNAYIHLTEKCLTALNWYKRITQSLLEQ
jgi:CRISPR/Cas system CMR-associated protein Cmr5 small subunit